MTMALINIGETASAGRHATEFLDMDFATVPRDRILASIVDRAPDASFAYVTTPNVDHVVRIQTRRSDLWPSYRAASMTLCDSRILSLLARLAGLRLSLMPGSDLTALLLANHVGPKDRVAIVGGVPASIDRLRRRLGIGEIVHHNPPHRFIDDQKAIDEAVEFVVAARARYTLLAVGSPQQEILAHRIARTGRAHGIGLCVGASLDFLTGEQVRAPRWIQMLALEWLHRLMSNPQRMWRRYLLEGPLILSIFIAWRKRRGATVEKCRSGRERCT